MFSALTRVTARRVWFVPHFGVWGAPDWGDIKYLAIEETESVKSVLFGSVSIGDCTQTVLFEDLIDHRGNPLPATLDNPCVMVRPRTGDRVFVAGDETPSGFKIARTDDGYDPVTVDLLVMELGS